MANEQEITVKALKTSIQMEIDGKEYYKKASKASTNKLGKSLLKRLAEEEDIHRTVFENIYNTIRADKGWPGDQHYQPDAGQRLRTVFAEAIEDMNRDTKAIPSEMDAIQTAMEMENKTYDFYTRRSAASSFAVEKQFYDSVAVQEKEHHRVLLDYYEFLKNPAAWFVEKEHPSIDGG
jgi:rubrerythrin